MQVRAVDANGAGVLRKGASGGYLFTLPAQGGLLSCAAASRDGSRVVAGTVGGALNVWEGGGGGSSGGGGSGGGGGLGDGGGGSWSAEGVDAMTPGCEIVPILHDVDEDDDDEDDDDLDDEEDDDEDP